MTDELLNGRVSLITGASSGIGRSTAVVFAAYGASLLLADIDQVGGEETAELVATQGWKAIFVQTDVSSVRDVEAMVTAAVHHFGRLDCAFNNAGIDG
jgi:NAD(P)-dependent dehydrogenase (short-subunit alcohol dehydrogenase family)